MLRALSLSEPLGVSSWISRPPTCASGDYATIRSCGGGPVSVAHGHSIMRVGSGLHGTCVTFEVGVWARWAVYRAASSGTPRAQHGAPQPSTRRALAT